MKDTPIPFSAPMVQAILQGRKTQTRRVARQPVVASPRTYGSVPKCQHGVPGDRLWVREAWRTDRVLDELKPSLLGTGAPIFYEADATRAKPHQPSAGRPRNSMFMPKWASRIHLEITALRLEPVARISGQDAKAEGAPQAACYGPECPDGGEGCNARGCYGAREWFEELWGQLHGPDSFGRNPLVWVISFKVLQPLSAVRWEASETTLQRMVAP